jgi:hypothetical protein
MKLQSIQKEQRKLQHKGDSAKQSMQLASFKEQFDSIKQQNDSAIYAIDMKQKEFEK